LESDRLSTCLEVTDYAIRGHSVRQFCSSSSLSDGLSAIDSLDTELTNIVSFELNFKHLARPGATQKPISLEIARAYSDRMLAGGLRGLRSFLYRLVTEYGLGLRENICALHPHGILLKLKAKTKDFLRTVINAVLCQQ